MEIRIFVIFDFFYKLDLNGNAVSAEVTDLDIILDWA